MPFVALALAAGCGGSNTGGSDVAAPDGVEIEPVGPYIHVLADLDYPRPAPSGGDHTPAPYWLNCGVYDGVVPDELAVHSLEHGAVWIALGPTAADADRTTAAALAAEFEKVIVSDVPDLPDAVELVAWEHRLRLDHLADDRAPAFLRALIDAPTAPEAGALCAQALGDPPTPPALPAQ